MNLAAIRSLAAPAVLQCIALSIASITWIVSVPSLASSAEPPAAAEECDMALRWNQIALEAGKEADFLMQGRSLAMTHAAIFDAVNGVEGRFAPYFVRERAPAGASPEAAAAAAAHTVLLELYPHERPVLDAALAASLASVPPSRGRDDGASFGRTVGRAILDWRARDHAMAVVEPALPQKPGGWRPTPPAFAPPLAPHWGTVAPFLLGDPDRFAPPPPPALESEQYARELAEVREIGGRDSSIRTADQTEACAFWCWIAPRIWSLAARQALAARPDLSLVERARVLALLSGAIADAFTVGWGAKYRYSLWRPVTAIREAAEDGNPATEPDTAWSPLLATPPFPCYVSGHAITAGAAAAVLAMTLGGDDASLRITNPEVGVTRSYDSFRQLAVEAREARIWSGVHFRASQQVALEAGVKIGEEIARAALQPVGSASILPSSASRPEER